MTASACVACPTAESPALVERHHDKIGGVEYRVLACASCGVVFSEPREAVGPDWYEADKPIRGHEFKSDPAADWRFNQFLSEDLAPGRLLDLGCGDGAFLGLAKARGWAVAGFDYDARMIEAAKAAGIADATADTFDHFFAARGAAEFDAITLFDVLEHVPEPGAFLDKVAGLLKPGGHLAVTLPNAKRPLWFTREEHDYPPHHFTRWTPEALRGFLERRGFEVVRQDASALRLSYVADHIFFYGMMRPLLGPLKRLLFGVAAAGKTVSEVAKDGRAGALADPVRRHRLVAAFRALMKLPILPLALLIKLRYALRTDAGNDLYTLARKKVAA